MSEPHRPQNGPPEPRRLTDGRSMSQRPESRPVIDAGARRQTEGGRADQPRVRNITGTSRCTHCINGLATIGHRREGQGQAELHGPCPWCEQGAQKEFPQKHRPHWEGGYWQGRTPETVPQPPEGKPLPHDENTLRWRLMMRRYAGENVNPCVGLDLTDPKRRMDLLRQELARKAPAA